MEINITGFSDWGLGIGDWEALPSHQSPVPSTLSRQLVFNGSLATYEIKFVLAKGFNFRISCGSRTHFLEKIAGAEID